MKNLKDFVYVLATPFSVLLIGCSTTLESGGTRALFETRAEAEKAAKDFNCKGAHQMGDKWMPCYSHDTHEGTDKHENHGGHHHH